MKDAEAHKTKKTGGKGIFLKRFLQRPKQVASIIPSSKVLVKKVVGKMDFSKPRVIAEFGPGEGCHTREILRRAHADSKILLFELDPELCVMLREQFAHDKRVEVLNTDCRNIIHEMAPRGIEKFDYIFSGIPFSLMDAQTKQELMYNVYESLAPNSCFIIYQVTNELKRFGSHFDRLESEWCPINLPPMFVTVYHKNGHSAPLQRKAHKAA
ncbi:rRNA adenine N-6-methyltransferase family protein [soil metagenome]